MITVHHVTKQFGRVKALDDVSLEISPGERVALIGTNGSGKTTLLRAMCGLLRVEGRIEIGGRDVAADPVAALSRLAYMPQVAPPLDAPVRELVRAFCTLRGRDIAEVAELAESLGLAFEALAAVRARDLSGGMKQKLLAAMALAARTDVLVCDEPTANLDGHARDAFFAQVAKRPPESVLVVCSHRIDEVRKFVDRVVEMKDGRIARDVVIRDTEHPLRSVQ